VNTEPIRQQEGDIKLATKAINPNIGSAVNENKGSAWRQFTELLA